MTHALRPESTCQDTEAPVQDSARRTAATPWRTRLGAVAAAATAALLWAGLEAPAQAQASAQDRVLNLYSARHYQTDEALYANFTKKTGIEIRRIDADDAGILARLRAEGAASPADVILLVDAARLWKGEIDGLFQPVRSPTLEKAVPARLRGKDDGQGAQWFALSTRARVIVSDPATVAATDADEYADLAAPQNRGKVCTRSGAHPYNLSLFGGLMEHWGPARTESWLKGVVANMPRAPKGGDTDQIRAVGSGECGLALSNSYYVARLMRSTKPEDIALMKKLRVTFPDQAGAGTHMNIAGGAVARNAPHKAAAVAFLEYLVSPEAQIYFADGNNEWPVVANVKPQNPALSSWGTFKQDVLPVATLGVNQVKVQQMLDRVGYR